MNKILTFIVNEFNELLLLKGSPKDPQFNKSFWYVVTGGYEGKDCTEYAYISFTNKDNVVLNEENIDYRWYNLDDFIKRIEWFGDKKELKNVLTCALERKLYFENEKVEEFK